MRRLLPILLAGCGLGGASGGGGTELPVSGAGPYRKLTDFEHVTDLDEPYLVSEDAADLADPSAIEIGGTLRLYYTRERTEILRVDVPLSLTDAASPPAPALAADEDWEQGGVRAPSVVASGDTILMFYQGTGGGIGRAESLDGGITWTKKGRVMDGAEPSIIVADGTLFLYRTLPPADGVYVSWTLDGQTWQDQADPVLAAAATPHAAGGITAAGELHVALVYSMPVADGSSAIFYAGSEDGLGFESRPTPILDKIAPSETTPSLVLEPTRSILLFAQQRTQKTAIAAAKAP